MHAQVESWIAEIVDRAQEVLGSAEQASQPERAVLTAGQLAAMIDHTLLKPEATPEMCELLCREAQEYRFASVCVNPCYVAHCARLLQGTGVPVCSVIGFPLGANTTAIKVLEAQRAIEDGAHEIDMVIQVGQLKAAGRAGYGPVKDDVGAVVQACHQRDALCKVIIETALLTDEEKVVACLLAVAAGADFAKTSTGFGPAGATVKDVALMRAAVGPRVGIKAAGGIRDYETAIAMVRAGANRIGASASVKIMQQARG